MLAVELIDKGGNTLFPICLPNYRLLSRIQRGLLSIRLTTAAIKGQPLVVNRGIHYLWNYENQIILGENPDGQRVTMAYNANNRRVRKVT